MPKIPLYQRQSTVSTQGTAVEMNPQVAASPFKAMAQLGGEATKIATEFGNRRTQLKQEADWSDYEVRKRKLIADIEKGKADAIKNGTATISNVNDVVVAPLLADFEAANLNQQYSNTSYRRISQNWDVSRQAIETEGVLEQASMELGEYTSRIKTNMGNIIAAGGDYSQQEAALVDSIGVVATKETISDLYSSAYNNRLATIMTQTQAGEMGAGEAINQMEELNTENAAKQTDPKRRMATENALNAGIASIKSTAVKDRAQRVTQAAANNTKLMKGAASGKLDSTDAVVVFNALGKKIEDEQVEAVAASISRGAAIMAELPENRGDATFPAIQMELVKYANKKKTLSEVMKAIEKRADDYIEQFKEPANKSDIDPDGIYYSPKKRKEIRDSLVYSSYAQLATLAYSNIDNQESVAMYDAGWYAKQHVVKLEGIYADGQRKISDYLAMGGSDPDWVQETGQFLMQLNQRKHTLSEEEVTEEFNNHFAQKATRVWKERYTNKKTSAESGESADFEAYREQNDRALIAGWNLKHSSFPATPTPVPPETVELEKSRRYYSEREGRLLDDAELMAIQQVEYGPNATPAIANSYNVAKAVDAENHSDPSKTYYVDKKTGVAYGDVDGAAVPSKPEELEMLGLPSFEEIFKKGQQWDTLTMRRNERAQELMKDKGVKKLIKSRKAREEYAHKTAADEFPVDRGLAMTEVEQQVYEKYKPALAGWGKLPGESDEEQRARQVRIAENEERLKGYRESYAAAAEWSSPEALKTYADLINKAQSDTPAFEREAKEHQQAAVKLANEIPAFMVGGKVIGANATVAKVAEHIKKVPGLRKLSPALERLSKSKAAPFLDRSLSSGSTLGTVGAISNPDDPIHGATEGAKFGAALGMFSVNPVAGATAMTMLNSAARINAGEDVETAVLKASVDTTFMLLMFRGGHEPRNKSRNKWIDKALSTTRAVGSDANANRAAFVKEMAARGRKGDPVAKEWLRNNMIFTPAEAQAQGAHKTAPATRPPSPPTPQATPTPKGALVTLRQKFDAKSRVPWTFGELYALHQNNDAAGIDAIVSQADLLQQSNLRRALENPTPETTATLNKNIAEDPDYSDVEIAEDLTDYFPAPAQPQKPDQLPDGKEMEVNDLIDLIAESFVSGEKAPPALIEALQSKASSPSHAEALIAEVKDRARGIRKERKAAASLAEEADFQKPDFRLAGRTAEAEVLFEQAGRDLFAGNMSKRSEARDRAARKQYDEAGETVDFDEYASDFSSRLAWNTIERRHELLIQHIRDGSVATVQAILESEGVPHQSNYYKAVVNAAEVASGTQKVTDIETNRVETREEPIRVADASAQSQSLIDAMHRIQERGDHLAGQWMAEIDVENLRSLTQEDFDRIMQYASFAQDYDPTVKEVKFSELDKPTREFFTRWDVFAEKNRTMYEEISDTFGIDFEAVAGFYFPLRHGDGNGGFAGTTIEDLIRHSSGSMKKRHGKFEGVLKDPVRQVENLVRDSAMLAAIAEELGTQIDSVKGNANEIAVALEKKKSEQELTPKEEKLLEILDDARAVEKEATRLGVYEQASLSDEFFASVSMFQKDGGGAQIPSIASVVGENAGILSDLAKKYGTTWSMLIEPSMMTQFLDGLDGMTEDGRWYGAHSRVLHRLFADAANLRTLEERREATVEKMLVGLDKKQRAQRNNDLHSIFLGYERGMRIPDIMKEFGVNRETADMADMMMKSLVAGKVQIALSRDHRSKVSELSTERRIAFAAIERAVQEGVQTEEEMLTYLEFAKEAEGEKTKSSILRNAARAIFEKQALDNKDFLGYYSSIMSHADRGAVLPQRAAQFEAWADYLESQGNKPAADWWRNLNDRNVKNKPFEWENKVLEGISGLVADWKGATPDPDGIYSNSDIVNGRTPEQIYRLMLESANLISRARVNAYLTGNFGWTLVTQWTSLTLTGIEVGFRETWKSIKRFKRGEIDTSGGYVPIIKDGDNVDGLQAVSDIESAGLSKTKRELFRRWINGLAAKPMERFTVEVSWDAGYRYAKETLKASDEEALIHADFVAAQTQSMYDSLCRNPMLNSSLYRFMKPMQSYVFTAFGQTMKTVGLAGMKTPRAERVARHVKWVIAQRFIALIMSLILGDKLKKALFDPTVNNGTLGSVIPAFGKGVDISISKILPWKEDKSWQDSEAHEKFLKQTGRVIAAILKGDEHAAREAAVYAFDYITPMAGIPGSVPMKNTARITSAAINHGRFEGLTGRKYADFLGYKNPIRWAGGIMFGIKAVDKPDWKK